MIIFPMLLLLSAEANEANYTWTNHSVLLCFVEVADDKDDYVYMLIICFVKKLL